MRVRFISVMGSCLALGAGLFAPIATASATPLAASSVSAASFTWGTPVDVTTVNPTPTDLQLVTADYYDFVAQTSRKVITAAWLAGGNVTVVESVDGGETFTNPLTFSPDCTTSLSSLAIASYNKYFAAAYECNGDVVVSQAEVADLLNRTDDTVSPTGQTTNGDVGVGFAGSPNGSFFSPVVSWVYDGASDDTAYVATNASGLNNTWNRDDSPIAVATGTNVAAGTTYSATGIQGANSAVALNVDDTALMVTVRRFASMLNPANVITIANNVAAVPTVATSTDAEYLLASWTTSDDTVQSSLSSQGGSFFPNPPYDVTSTAGDRGQPGIAMGYSGADENKVRRVVVFDDSTSGTREVIAEVSDDSTTFTTTTLSVVGETVESAPQSAPRIAGSKVLDNTASIYWIASSGGSQRVKSALGSTLNPANASTFTWDPTVSVSSDFTSIDAVAGHGDALGWFADDGSTVTLQVAVFGFGPGPGPGPGPNPGPSPDPATPAGPVRDLAVEAGDSSVTVSWEAPASTGDFPITNYQVTTQPVSAASCLVPASSTSCVLAPLTNNTTYTVRVRALTGAGWGSWATSDSVTPSPGTTKTILVEGSRTENGRRVQVTGQTTGLARVTVQAQVKVGGEQEFSAGSTRVVSESGSFTWKRRGPAEVSVFFTAEGATSNTLTIPSR